MTPVIEVTWTLLVGGIGTWLVPRQDAATDATVSQRETTPRTHIDRPELRGFQGPGFYGDCDPTDGSPPVAGH